MRRREWGEKGYIQITAHNRPAEPTATANSAAMRDTGGNKHAGYGRLRLKID